MKGCVLLLHKSVRGKTRADGKSESGSRIRDEVRGREGLTGCAGRGRTCAGRRGESRV
jgi:hypothetical protein